MENSPAFLFSVLNRSGRKIRALISVSDGLGISIVHRKMEKDEACKEEKGWKGVHFPPELELLAFFFNLKVPCLLCSLAWRVNNYVFRHRPGVNRRTESTKNNVNSTEQVTSQHICWTECFQAIFRLELIEKLEKSVCLQSIVIFFSPLQNPR